MNSVVSRATLMIGCLSLCNCAYLLEPPHFYPGPSFASNDRVIVIWNDGIERPPKRLSSLASARVVKLVNSLKGTWFDANDYPDFATDQDLEFRTPSGLSVGGMRLGEGGMISRNYIGTIYTLAGSSGRLFQDSDTAFEQVYIKIEKAIGAQ